MRTILNALPIALLLLCAADACAQEKYAPNMESVKTHEVPEWAQDAKFGIYTHRGPYSEIGTWDELDVYPISGGTYLVGCTNFYSAKHTEGEPLELKTKQKPTANGRE